MWNRCHVYFPADFDFESDLVLRARFAGGGVVVAFPLPFAWLRLELPFWFAKSVRVVCLAFLLGLAFAGCSCFSLADPVNEPSDWFSCSSSFSERGLHVIHVHVC